MIGQKQPNIIGKTMANHSCLCPFTEVIGFWTGHSRRHSLPAAAAGLGYRKEVRARLKLGATPHNAYLKAPRPFGLGMGCMDRQGAVDFLSGMGQLRYAPGELRKAVLQEIRDQCGVWGLNPTILVPQPGP